MARIEDASAVLVPTVVRVEAAVPRDATNADVNRLTRDATIGTAVANAAVRLHPSSAVSPVDACVAAVADDEVSDDVLVEVLTSDFGHLHAMLGGRAVICRL
jgi:hypothetical protein